MTAEKIEIEKEEVLKIVNEDWPMLEELGKKRFVLNKKKTKDVQESINLLQSVLEEDNKLQEDKETIVSKQEVTPYVENSATQIVKNEKAIVTEEKTVTNVVHNQVNLEKLQPKEVVVNTEAISSPSPAISSQSVSSSVINKTTFVKSVKESKLEEEKSMDVFKFILAGLTHLYVSKTTNLLKPIKFVMENYKEVSIAMLHFIVPLIMTYLITTQIGFVHEQLVKETNFMKLVYVGVFFFGSTFVWISGQVLLAGIYSMLKKSMLDVAKVGKENK